MEILDALMVVFSLETITMILLGYSQYYYRRITRPNSEYGDCITLPLTYSFQGMTGISCY